jgi:hypothetical protein
MGIGTAEGGCPHEILFTNISYLFINILSPISVEMTSAEFVSAVNNLEWL